LEEAMTFLKNFMQNDEGVTAIEYALIAALIAVVLIASLTFLGTSLKVMFTNIGNKIPQTIS
jgi:pilus assembly protein Flp/PilA